MWKQKSEAERADVGEEEEEEPPDWESKPDPSPSTLLVAITFKR